MEVIAVIGFVSLPFVVRAAAWFREPESPRKLREWILLGALYLMICLVMVAVIHFIWPGVQNAHEYRN